MIAAVGWIKSGVGQHRGPFNDLSVAVLYFMHVNTKKFESRE